MTNGAIQPPAIVDATLADVCSSIYLLRKYLIDDNWPASDTLSAF
jgi:hypothetical protein